MKQAPTLSVAPMMDWTDRHCRFLHRLLSQRVLLYTEMVVDKAIIHGDRAKLLDAESSRADVVLQIGGSDPKELAQATKIAADSGYTHVNLNCGCPSDRVQSGQFGAALMKTPHIVADAVSAMRQAAPIEISVKCRLGVDDQEAEKTLPEFIQIVSDAGIQRFIIHARKAWLSGLSPKENRKTPPLDYDLAYTIKTAHPDFYIGLNGGLASLEQGARELDRGFDEVMFGRAAYHQPYDILATLDARFYHATRTISRLELVAEMVDYIAQHIENGGRAHQVLRHILGLYHEQNGGRKWRQILTDMGSGEFDAAKLIATAKALDSPFA